MNRIASLRLTALVVGLFAAGPAAAASWSYEGHGGPAEWAKISTDFAACEGKDQSPIDIKNPIPARLGEIKVSYRPQSLAVINNGHTIQVNFKPGNSMEFEGETFDLVQYHFHTPSEHAFDGKRSPMEAHLVHKGATSGKLAVLGVMMVPGKPNDTIEAIWNAMPTEAGPEKEVAEALLNPQALLPANQSYFRYEGSLTTPPCSEVVKWINLKQPIEVSQAQLDRFAKLFPMNARPLQPVNRRFILETEGK
ncbi:MAG: carbonic anhydrase family protein [Alphaproteobacteria bacterium]|nr:carbonic anhydrase family protein [Alphaproteobacteria bacterium]